MQTTYEQENERSFKLPVKNLMQLMKDVSEGKIPMRFLKAQTVITQKWLSSKKINNTASGDEACTERVRIRKEVTGAMPPLAGISKCVYYLTTKFYFTKDGIPRRYELNAPMSAEEYSFINDLYADTFEVKEKKRRLYAKDHTGLAYTFDIPLLRVRPDGKNEIEDVARMEIEFTTPEEAQKYKIPEYLKPYLSEEE